MVQIGTENSAHIEGCVNLNGQLNYNQCHYLIRHSLLHVGVDSFTSQFASGLGKKVVTLYGDVPPENSRPFWSNKEDSIDLIPNNKNGLYSYSSENDKKGIDTIKPEIIAKHVCDLLEIDFDYPFHTLNIGKEYLRRNIESIPAANPIDISNMKIDSLIMRMDLFFSEQFLVNQLSVSKCSIITERPIDPRILVHFRGKINELIYLLGDSHSKNYVKELSRLGIKCNLMTEKSEEKLASLKLEYLDYGPIHIKNVSKKDNHETLREKDVKNLYYKSSRSLIYNQKPYYCEAAIEDGIEIPTVGYSEPHKVIDKESFWKDSEKFIILEKK